MAITKKIRFPVSGFRFLENYQENKGRMDNRCHSFCLSAERPRLFAQAPYFHGSRVTFIRNDNYQENKVSSSEFRERRFLGRAVPAVGSLLVGRASVPAQVSHRISPLFSWFAGDFYKEWQLVRKKNISWRRSPVRREPATNNHPTISYLSKKPELGNYHPQFFIVSTCQGDCQQNRQQATLCISSSSHFEP